MTKGRLKNKSWNRIKDIFHRTKPEGSFRMMLSFKHVNENADASHLYMIEKRFIDGVCSSERCISHSSYTALSLKGFQIDV